jgi:pyridoxal phosphate enzyme (YggS family)
MISENIDRIRQRIVAACTRAGRDPSEVVLVAVSKTVPVEMIRAAQRAGLVDFGENYVQEMLRKQAALEGEPVRWHFIGHLQSNKVKAVAPRVHMIHSLESAHLAREIDGQAARAGRVIDVLVEVNTTGENSKFGLPPERVNGVVRELRELEAIRVCGLMTIGPFLPDPEGSRPMFRHLRELARQIAETGQPNVQIRHLSMGMTGDFEVAIEEGATMVRVGTAIFGPRPTPL